MSRLQDRISSPEVILDYFVNKAQSLCPQLPIRCPQRMRELFAANGFISFVIHQFMKKEFIKKGVAPVYDNAFNSSSGFSKDSEFSLSSVLAFEDKSEKLSRYAQKFRDPQGSFSQKANAAIESIFLLLSMSKLLKFQVPGLIFNVKLVKIGYRTLYRYQGFQGYRDRLSNSYIKNKYRQLRSLMPSSFFMGQKGFSSERTWTYVRVFYNRGSDNILDFWLYENSQDNRYFKMKGIWGWKQSQDEEKANLYFATFYMNQTKILGKCLEYLTQKGIPNAQITKLSFYAADTRFLCYPITFYHPCDTYGSLKQIRF